MSKLYHTIYYILIKIVSYIVVVLSGCPPHSQKKKGKKKKSGCPPLYLFGLYFSFSL